MQITKELAEALEHYITPEWAALKILEHEILTKNVVDPCCGFGVLSEVAKSVGANVVSVDIYDWGYHGTQIFDFFLSPKIGFPEDVTVFMNPPFSLACDFVRKSFDLGARKIICFQRLAWWESGTRESFWNEFPPNRIYICADRATCWRADLPQNEKGERFDPETKKKLAGSSTAHAWFVWERNHPKGTLISHIRK